MRTAPTAAHRLAALGCWQPQPEAARLVREWVDQVLLRCPQAADLHERMLNAAGVGIGALVDHLQLPYTAKVREALLDAGFEHRPVPGAFGRFHHPFADLPDVLLDEACVQRALRLALKVQDVSDFLSVHGIGPSQAQIEGPSLGMMRRALAFLAPHAEVWVVERRGFRGYSLADLPWPEPRTVLHHRDQFARRQRDFGAGPAADSLALQHLRSLIDSAITDLGREHACALFFEAERSYWMRRNAAAREQYARQQALGLGWANHDHHVYRSSRALVPCLAGILERLGLQCRERVCAGPRDVHAHVFVSQATGVVCACEVDVSIDEVLHDVVQDPLEYRPTPGTVDRWTGMHGESILAAGPHRLGVSVTMAAWPLGSRVGLASGGAVRMAEAQAEVWKPVPARLERMVTLGQIARDEASAAREQGQAGSLLVGVERLDGARGWGSAAFACQ